MSLPPGEITLCVFALFLLIYGLVFLWMSTRSDGTGQEKKDNKLLATRILFLGLAILYIGFSHLTLYALLVTQIDQGLTPGCEYLPNSSTINGSVITYSFVNSCESTTAPGGLVGILESYGWLLWLDAAILFFGSFFVGTLAFLRKLRGM